MGRRRGRLIVFEGVDGVGKTTLAGYLRSQIEAQNIPCELIAFPGRAEGTIGKFVYDFHHERGLDPSRRPLNPTSLQLLHIAAHIDAIEERILPALRDGICIILDRFWWSSWAYGIANGADRWSLDSMIRLERHHWRRIRPSLVVLLRRSVFVQTSRDDYAAKLDAAYKDLASACAAKYKVETIANDAGLEDICGKVLSITRPIWHPLGRIQPAHLTGKQLILPI